MKQELGNKHEKHSSIQTLLSKAKMQYGKVAWGVDEKPNVLNVSPTLAT